MAFISELRSRVEGLAAHAEIDVEAAELTAAIRSLADDDLVQVLADATGVIRDAERIRVIAAGVAAARSSRESGHSGLAQIRGHRSPVSFVQSITGGTRADATKQVRLGETLLETTGLDTGAGDTSGGVGPDETEPDHSTRIRPWHAPLDDALLSGVTPADKVDAILRGLGRPPTQPDDEAAAETLPATTDDSTGGIGEAGELWRVAAEQLLQDAPNVTVEDLGAMARTLRDQLDPEGAHHRFLARFENRSFRMHTDRDGATTARIVFDDEAAALVRTILDTALRPRRGGPRFIDSTEKEKSDELIADPRTLDQLSYDLVIDLLKTGSLATPEQVYGTRQAGVRLIAVQDQVSTSMRDAFGLLIGTIGHTEDHGHALPGPVIDQAICSTGQLPVAVDSQGNPLDVGREHRLYTPRQRIALAVRDGGCAWPQCDRPASYCEAHHIDGWATENGRTDINRGILLCRFHHMSLHHHGWRITRHDTGPFHLHPPSKTGDEPIVLESRSPLRRLWSPPPERRTAPHPHQKSPPTVPVHNSQPGSFRHGAKVGLNAPETTASAQS